MRTRPGVRSSEPSASGDDVIAVPSGTVRLTTIFKMADFVLPQNTTDDLVSLLLSGINHQFIVAGATASWRKNRLSDSQSISGRGFAA